METQGSRTVRKEITPPLKGVKLWWRRPQECAQSLGLRCKREDAQIWIQIWIQSPVWQLDGCITLGQPFLFSDPQFLHPYHGGNNHRGENWEKVHSSSKRWVLRGFIQTHRCLQTCTYAPAVTHVLMLIHTCAHLLVFGHNSPRKHYEVYEPAFQFIRQVFVLSHLLDPDGNPMNQKLLLLQFCDWEPWSLKGHPASKWQGQGKPTFVWGQNPFYNGRNSFLVF